MAVDSSITSIMDLNNPVFRAYLFYSSVLVLKVLLRVDLIGRQRFKKRIFISPEDTGPEDTGPEDTGAKWGKEDPDIERCRRAHLNDLENILIFFVAAWVFMCTNPEPWFAHALFLTYTVSRIAHTVVYAVVVVPQPALAIAWFVGWVITIYMAAQGGGGEEERREEEEEEEEERRRRRREGEGGGEGRGGIQN
ncbi:hypothetical protein WDU94_001758 [Cyamophila willieti]